MKSEVTKNMKETSQKVFLSKMKVAGAECARVFYQRGCQIWQYQLGAVVVGEMVEICHDPSRHGEFHWYC